MKEAIFSMLHSLPFDCEGARVLDCFAGSGSLAIEALSRGAAFAALVDSDRRALEAVGRNLALLKPAVGAAALCARWPQVLGKLAGQPPFSLFFLDPPYEKFPLALSLLKAFAAGLASPGAVAVWEQSPQTLERWNESDIAPWRVLKTRARGGQALAFLQLEEKGHDA